MNDLNETLARMRSANPVSVVEPEEMVALWSIVKEGVTMQPTYTGTPMRSRQRYGVYGYRKAAFVVAGAALGMLLAIVPVALLLGSGDDTAADSLARMSTVSPNEPGQPVPPASSTTTLAGAVSTRLYEVTMELVGDEGIATTCGTLIMRGGLDGDLVPDGAIIADGTAGSSVPRLHLVASEDLAWRRSYPEPLQAAGFGSLPADCHGGPVDDSPEQTAGVLVVSGLEEESIRVLWHFDYYTGNGVRENLTLSGRSPIAWSENGEGTLSGIVDGAFTVSWFQNVGGEPVHLFEPFEGSPRQMQFRISIIALSPSVTVNESAVLHEVPDGALAFAAIWNEAAAQTGFGHLIVSEPQARQNDDLVETEWQLGAEDIEATLTYVQRTDGMLIEIGFRVSTGYGTDTGKVWLSDGSHLVVSLSEPGLPDDEASDLTARLTDPTEKFAYEEVGSTAFLSHAPGEDQRVVIAATK